MPSLAHTPYDGSRNKPFSIGLAPLDLADWIEPDEFLAADRAEKARLFAECRDVVFGAEDGTEAAQQEVWSLLASHLPSRWPHLYRHSGDGLSIAGEVIVPGAQEPVLLSAARLIQEDLVLMRRGEAGWRVAAAALCFPSSWSLREKFGRSMDEVHEHVPGYAQMATRMARIFDALKVELPVWRLNWSIYPDRERHHPESKQLPRQWFDPQGRIDPDKIFIRVERQTLRKLPESGDILFTIKILADPFSAFASHPEGARLAMGLREQILAMDREQLAYKALTVHRDAIAETLSRLCALNPDRK